MTLASPTLMAPVSALRFALRELRGALAADATQPELERVPVQDGARR